MAIVGKGAVVEEVEVIRRKFRRERLDYNFHILLLISIDTALLIFVRRNYRMNLVE
jgi:hypothetical protein